MATLKSLYRGELRTEVEHLQSQTTIITDAPTDNNGRGEAFSPTDLVAAGLGSCMVTIMGMAARTHGFNIDGTTISTTKVMGTAPRRIVEIIVELNFPSDYEPKHRRIIEAAAKECPAANSLHPDLKQTVIFNYK